jgi:hypothetical protein
MPVSLTITRRANHIKVDCAYPVKDDEEAE